MDFKIKIFVDSLRRLEVSPLRDSKIKYEKLQGITKNQNPKGWNYCKNPPVSVWQTPKGWHHTFTT